MSLSHASWCSVESSTGEYGTFHFFIRTPAKDGGFLQRGVRILSSKKPTKFGPFRKFFQRCRQTINPSDFIFQRAVTDKKLRVRILPSLGGGADKKWNVPMGMEASGTIHLVRIY